MVMYIYIDTSHPLGSFYNGIAVHSFFLLLYYAGCVFRLGEEGKNNTYKRFATLL